MHYLWLTWYYIWCNACFLVHQFACWGLKRALETLHPSETICPRLRLSVDSSRLLSSTDIFSLRAYRFDTAFAQLVASPLSTKWMIQQEAAGNIETTSPPSAAKLHGESQAKEKLLVLSVLPSSQAGENHKKSIRSMSTFLIHWAAQQKSADGNLASPRWKYAGLQ